MTSAGYIPYLMHMVSDNLPSLRARLFAGAEAWSAATGRSLGALSSLVTNHGGTLDRLRDPGAAVTDITLEKFARFLIDPANWPEREADAEHQGWPPEAALKFGEAVGVFHDPLAITQDAGPSSGKAAFVTQGAAA